MADIIGDGERIEVHLFMLDDDTFDQVRARLVEFLTTTVLDLPVRAELHDGFDVEDFG